MRLSGASNKSSIVAGVPSLKAHFQSKFLYGFKFLWRDEDFKPARRTLDLGVSDSGRA